MDKTHLGYIYIATNPSFNKEWVKIGRTTNLDERLRNLDCTSVPLPFEFYAALRTPDYERVESLIHEMLFSIRIREQREFFRISPRKACAIFRLIASLLPGAEVLLISEEAKEDNKEREKSQYERDCLRFWSDFVEYSNSVSGLFADIKPLPQNWLNKGFNAPFGVVLGVCVDKTQVRAELYFSSTDKAQNKSVFDYLEAHKREIESEYGKPLVWQRLSTRTACRIKTESRHAKGLESSAFAFLNDETKRLVSVFRPWLYKYKADKREPLP